MTATQNPTPAEAWRDGAAAIARAAATALALLPFVALGVAFVILGLSEDPAEPGYAGVGLAVAAGALCGVAFVAHAASIHGRRLRLVRAHPEEPWLWDVDWCRGESRSSDAREVAALWGLAVVWNTFVWPLVPSLTEPDAKAVGVVFLALCGVALLAGALVRTRRWRREGTAVLRFLATPVPVGDALEATLHADASLARAGLRLELSCRRTRPGSDASDEVLWKAEQLVPTHRIGRDWGGILVPVAFAIPAGLPPAHRAAKRPIEWRLDVQTDAPRGPWSASFELPVFHA